MRAALMKFSISFALLMVFIIVACSACAEKRESYAPAQTQEQQADTTNQKDNQNLSESEKVGLTCTKMIEMARSTTDSLIVFSSHPFSSYSSCGYWILAEGGK